MGGQQGILVAGRYRLISESGRGGRGTVWRAHDEVLGRDVAVKELHLAEWTPEEERRALCRRLMSEAKATAALRHPGVVTVHDIVEDDDRPWIVMEYVQAPSLQQVIDGEGRLPPHRAARIGSGMLAAVRAAHAAGILHRDIKPGNVLLPADGRVVLTDFGLAVRTTECDGGLPAEGSPAYISPEQAWSRPITEASDLWSLGATLYAAVEGRAPFARREPLASLVAVLIDDYPPPAHAGALRPVIDGLLRRDPADRLTADEAARRLERVLARRPPGSYRPRPAMGLLAGLAAVSLLAVGAGESSGWRDQVRTGTTTLTLQARAVFNSGTLMTYRDPEGFAVDVPATWQRVEQTDGTYWYDPDDHSMLRISKATGEPLPALQAAERLAVTRHAFPGYRRLRLEQVPGPGYKTVEWEFVWSQLTPQAQEAVVRARPHRMGGARTARGAQLPEQTMQLEQMHSLRARTEGYDFYFVTSDARWTPGVRRLEAIWDTFRPDDHSATGEARGADGANGVVRGRAGSCAGTRRWTRCPSSSRAGVPAPAGSPARAGRAAAAR